MQTIAIKYVFNLGVEIMVPKKLQIASQKFKFKSWQVVLKLSENNYVMLHMNF